MKNIPANKSVYLRKKGEPPTWSPVGGSHSFDEEIRSRKSASKEEQEESYRRFALFLFDNRFKDLDDEEAYDHSDDEKWLISLAEWFGWSWEEAEDAYKDALQRHFRTSPS